MRRGFTDKEIKRITHDGKKLGVTYSKEEQEVLKNLTFEEATITDEGMLLVKPQ